MAYINSNETNKTWGNNGWHPPPCYSLVTSQNGMVQYLQYSFLNGLMYFRWLSDGTK